VGKNSLTRLVERIQGFLKGFKMSVKGINWKALVKETLIRRKAKGLTQKAHADVLGISVPTLSKFECGETNMSLDIVFKILDSVDLLDKPASAERADFERFIEMGNSVYRKLEGTNDAYFSMACQIHESWPYGGKSFLRNDMKQLKFYPLVAQHLIRPNTFRFDENPVFPQLNYFGLTSKTNQPLIYAANQYFEDMQAQVMPGSFMDAVQPLVNMAKFVYYCMDIAAEYTNNRNCKYSFSITFNRLLGRIMRNQSFPLNGTMVEPECSGAAIQDSVTLTLDIFPYQTNDDTLFDLALPLYQAFGFSKVPKNVRKNYNEWVLRNVPQWARYDDEVEQATDE
jgi:transcriptional regulator with XRE-family HTH domain